MEWASAMQVVSGVASTTTAVICALLLYRMGKVEKEVDRTRLRLHGVESQMIAYKWMIRILGGKSGLDMSVFDDESKGER